MQFEKFEARRITIRKATKSDIEKYEQQLKVHDMLEMDKVLEISKEQCLAIESDAGKMIGIIQVLPLIENEKAYIEISIPNEAWRRRYGTEALHQFNKCCKKRKMYTKLLVKKDNSIVENYRNGRPELFENTDSFINLEKVI